jgi:hypothetical protein
MNRLAVAKYHRLFDRRVEVAVKNSKRPDGLKHADVDNVWGQFYPTMRSQTEKP